MDEMQLCLGFASYCLERKESGQRSGLGSCALGMAVIRTGWCVHENFLYYFVEFCVCLEVTIVKQVWEYYRFTLVLSIKLYWINTFKRGGT